jgi:hypothetical protein
MVQKQGPALARFIPLLVVSLIVASLYVTACACPAIEFEKRVPRDYGDITLIPESWYNPLPGVGALVLGCVPPLIIPWSANLLLLVGWVLLLCNKNTVALGFGVAAALVGSSTWVFSSVWKQLLVGYYLWQASLIAFALGALVLRLWRPPGRRALTSEGGAAPEELSGLTG